MPLILKGVEYQLVIEVATAAGVRRETFWRWRKDRKVPQGRQYRNTRIFTSEEAAEVCAYATTAKPLEDIQIALFRRRPR
jgi:predicted DNA-binding transcriptional regulator AlpA